MCEPLPEDLHAALAASADRRGPFGTPALFFTETGSTNDVAAGMAEHGAPEGAMALALAQRKGRGRLGREWFSPPGAGLYVSIVCRSTAAAPYLTLAGGVAVADGIRQATGLPVALKWPNDVVVRDAGAPGKYRKLAGILAEGATGPDGRIQYVVLGIGINVTRAAYPPDIADRASSLEAELGRAVDRGLVLAEMLVALRTQVDALERGASAEILERWRALSPSASGARVEWEAGGRRLQGLTVGIDDAGALLVNVGGRLERIVAGEIRWV